MFFFIFYVALAKKSKKAHYSREYWIREER